MFGRFANRPCQKGEYRGITRRETAPGRRQWKEAPALIAEVLSPSTEAYDRGRKFAAYRLIPGLAAVLFLSQTGPFVECYTRVGENEWRLTEACGVDGVVNLAALDFSLPLAELYRDLPDETEVKKTAD